MNQVQTTDDDVMTKAVGSYWAWLLGRRAQDPALVFATLSPDQRALYIRRIDDLNFVWSFTSQLPAAEPEPRPAAPRRE